MSWNELSRRIRRRLYRNENDERPHPYPGPVTPCIFPHTLTSYFADVPDCVGSMAIGIDGNLYCCLGEMARKFDTVNAFIYLALSLARYVELLELRHKSRWPLRRFDAFRRLCIMTETRAYTIVTEGSMIFIAVRRRPSETGESSSEPSTSAPSSYSGQLYSPDSEHELLSPRAERSAHWHW